MRVYVDAKGNGFVITALADGPQGTKELVVEGTDPKKVGAAVLAMFKAPRKSRAKKEGAA